MASKAIEALVATRVAPSPVPAFDPAVWARALEAMGPAAAAHSGRAHEVLLRARNGLWGLSRALHVFGACDAPAHHGLLAWNAQPWWQAEYDGLADGLFFFAEDAFGDQFAYVTGPAPRASGDAAGPGEVVRFYAEDGRREAYAPGFEAWAAKVVGDPRGEVSEHVVHAWQKANGALPEGRHICPAIPFIFAESAKLKVESFRALPVSESLGAKGSVARQLRDLPEGAQVKLALVD